MAAAAEDDEKVGWGSAFAGSWAARVEGGEDVDETELLEKGVNWEDRYGMLGGLTNAVVMRTMVKARM